MAQIVDKKVKVKLVGNANVFALIGVWKKQAQRESWTPGEISKVLEVAIRGDYDHVLGVLSDHCVNGGFE